MLEPARVPLAWLNLVHRKFRFLVTVTGVSFAVVLMFTEIGFWNALLDSMSAVVDHLDADLIILNRDKVSMVYKEPFSRRRLEQARSVPGVASVRPLYVETRYGLWKNADPSPPGEPNVRPIRILACDLDMPALGIPEIVQYAEELKLPDTVLMDSRSKAFFGRRDPGVDTELTYHNVHVVGNFTLGADFAYDGNVFMSSESFARFFPTIAHGQPPLSQVEVGVIKLASGAVPAEVLAGLRDALPEDVVVMTHAQFSRMERDYWQRSTPVGFVFGLGLVMGFVVGVIICYQILSADLNDHLAEFATLKAMGYPNRFLIGVVFQEALMLSGFGYLPGLGIALLVYAWLSGVTGLTMQLSLSTAALILIFTVGMCTISGLIAIRKVTLLDPAEVF